MRVLGLDPSSALSGGAVVQNGKLRKTMIWEKNPAWSHPRNLHDWFNTVKAWCRDEKPDMACVEALSVARGAQVTRMIAFYQAAAVLACKEMGVMVIEARVKSARKVALGNGNLDKEAAHKAVKKMFPKHKFKAYPHGGADETDATVLGVAGPTLAE